MGAQAQRERVELNAHTLGRRVRRVGFIAALLVLWTLWVPGGLSAQEVPDPGFFLPVGASVGGVYDADAEAFSLLLGGDVSLVYLFGTAWIGGTIDGAYDFGPDAVRLSGGLEAGWFLFGLEAGTFAENDANGWSYGSRVGLLWSMSLVGSALRWSHDWVEGTDRFELTVMLKWPFWLGEEQP